MQSSSRLMTRCHQPRGTKTSSPGPQTHSIGLTCQGGSRSQWRGGTGDGRKRAGSSPCLRRRVQSTPCAHLELLRRLVKVEEPLDKGDGRGDRGTVLAGNDPRWDHVRREHHPLLPPRDDRVPGRCLVRVLVERRPAPPRPHDQPSVVRPAVAQDTEEVLGKKVGYLEGSQLGLRRRFLDSPPATKGRPLGRSPRSLDQASVRWRRNVCQRGTGAARPADCRSTEGTRRT